MWDLALRVQSPSTDVCMRQHNSTVREVISYEHAYTLNAPGEKFAPTTAMNATNSAFEANAIDVVSSTPTFHPQLLNCVVRYATVNSVCKHYVLHIG